MSNLKGKFPVTAITLAGLEDVLAEELKGWGAEEVETSRRAVTFVGDKKLIYILNYHSRLALRFLIPLEDMEIKGQDDLYNAVYNIPWEDWITVNNTIAVDTLLNSSMFKHNHFPSLKAKDAIVDRFRKQTGDRPSVDPEEADMRIHLRVQQNQLYISIDSSGRSLNKRGYRDSGHIAPLNEVLAAGLVALSEWDCNSTFLDPMCGSGTILIEAAMKARGIPAGSLRSYFPFKKWKGFDKDLWNEVKNMESIGASTSMIPDMLGFDHSGKALSEARENIRRAGLTAFIELEKAEFGEYRAPRKKGIIIMNPPYGERIQPEDIDALYKEIGDIFKQKFEGFQAWILSANMEALKKVGLKSKRRIPLYNGKLECRFVNYELY